MDPAVQSHLGSRASKILNAKFPSIDCLVSAIHCPSTIRSLRKRVRRAGNITVSLDPILVAPVDISGCDRARYVEKSLTPAIKIDSQCVSFRQVEF
jgi:hypothetical protein